MNKEKTRAAQTLDEQEMEYMAGRNAKDGFVCDKCGCTECDLIIERQLFPAVSFCHRECRECHNETPC